MEQNSAIDGRSTHGSADNHHSLLVSEGKRTLFSPITEVVVPFLDELKYKKICYFTNWAQYRSSPAKFEPEDIDPFLCTHIVYAFAYINNETFLISKVEENDGGTDERSAQTTYQGSFLWYADLYRRINALKRRNPALKTLLGVGGWNMKSYAFSAMIHTDETRRNFVFDSIK